MDLVTNERTETPVNHLVTRNLAFALKLVGDDDGLEMRVIVAGDGHNRVLERCFDQIGDG